MRFKQFVEELTGIEPNQAKDAHEPTGEASVSSLNPLVQTEINSRLGRELGEYILSVDNGFQRIRKVLHRYGFDLPSLYEPDPDGDELIIEINQFGLNDLSLNIYILYYRTDEGAFEFYSEIGDDARMEYLIMDGIEEE
jgi:hypothetical protein